MLCFCHGILPSISQVPNRQKLFWTCLLMWEGSVHHKMSEQDQAKDQLQDTSQDKVDLVATFSETGGVETRLNIPEDHLLEETTDVLKSKTGHKDLKDQTNDCLTQKELEDVTTVFRHYEIGLRGGCIDVKVDNSDHLRCRHNSIILRIFILP